MISLRLLIPIVVWSILMPALHAADPKPQVLTSAPETLTEVSISVYVIDLLSISGAEQAFTADVSTSYIWKDARLEHSGTEPKTVAFDSIWSPQIMIANLRSASAERPMTAEVQPDGTVKTHQRIAGTFTSHFDLREFPNDTQTLSIQFITRGHKAFEVTLVEDMQLTGRAQKFTLSDWAVGDVILEAQPYVIPEKSITIPGVCMKIEVERYVGYYVGSILTSASIIICMAWLVFWIPPVAINPRISVSVTSMLTLIAHRFVVQGELPNLPYLTTMDYFLLGSTLMVLLGLIEVVAVFRVLNRGDEVKAQNLNRFFRYSYPIPFIALIAYVLL